MPYLLAILASITFLAAFVLTVEKIERIKNPAFQLPCNINPIISCGSVMKTHQAEAFGFANSLIGIAGYAVLATIGLVLLAAALMAMFYLSGS